MAGCHSCLNPPAAFNLFIRSFSCRYVSGSSLKERARSSSSAVRCVRPALTGRPLVHDAGSRAPAQHHHGIEFLPGQFGGFYQSKGPDDIPW